MLIDDENSGQEAQLTLFNTHRRFSCSARINLPSVKCTSLGIKHKEMGASIRLAKTSLCLDAIKAAGYLWKQLCTEIWVSNIEARDFWERSDRNGQQRGTVFWGRGDGNHCLHNGVITPNSRGVAGSGGVDRSFADRSSGALINSECYYVTPSFDAQPCAVDGLRLRRSIEYKTFLDSQ